MTMPTTRTVAGVRDIRRGCLDRCPHRLRVEGIGTERVGAQFAKTIDAPFGTRHAAHFMAARAQRAYQRQTDSARGACNEYLHAYLRCFTRALRTNSILSRI
jgi:hypothetical protein